MKKRTVRIVAILGIVLVMMLGLAGCKKKTECYWCGEMKYCEVFHASLLGDMNLCKECKELVEPISDNLKPLEEME
ncbi:MAG: hypothetical protein PUC73_10760 [Lachnospiraceae bacterium]|nr:hypothetical protein [Lachnospiraceae bacterium]